MLSELTGPLSERGITLTWDDTVPALLAAQSVGGKRGARDLRNAIRRQVVDRLATLIVEQCDRPLSAVFLSTADGAVVLRAL